MYLKVLLRGVILFITKIFDIIKMNFKNMNFSLKSSYPYISIKYHCKMFIGLYFEVCMRIKQNIKKNAHQMPLDFQINNIFLYTNSLS